MGLRYIHNSLQSKVHEILYKREQVKISMKVDKLHSMLTTQLKQFVVSLIHTTTPTQTRAHKYVHTNTHMVDACVCTHTHTHIYIYIYTHIYRYTHIHTHTHKHTHTLHLHYQLGSRGPLARKLVDFILSGERKTTCILHPLLEILTFYVFTLFQESLSSL